MRKILFIIQDNWNNEGWKDFKFGGAHPKDEDDASKQFKELTTNPIWLGEGKREWRMVRRTITDTILPEYIVYPTFSIDRKEAKRWWRDNHD